MLSDSFGTRVEWIRSMLLGIMDPENVNNHGYKDIFLSTMSRIVRCCGADGPDDYVNYRVSPPPECINSSRRGGLYYERGCARAFSVWLKAWSGTISGVMIVIAIMEVFAIYLCIELIKVYKNRTVLPTEDPGYDDDHDVEGPFDFNKALPPLPPERSSSIRRSTNSVHFGETFERKIPRERKMSTKASDHPPTPVHRRRSLERVQHQKSSVPTPPSPRSSLKRSPSTLSEGLVGLLGPPKSPKARRRNQSKESFSSESSRDSESDVERIPPIPPRKPQKDSSPESSAKDFKDLKPTSKRYKKTPPPKKKMFFSSGNRRQRSKSREKLEEDDDNLSLCSHCSECQEIKASEERRKVSESEIQEPLKKPRFGSILKTPRQSQSEIHVLDQKFESESQLNQEPSYYKMNSKLWKSTTVLDEDHPLLRGRRQPSRRSIREEGPFQQRTSPERRSRRSRSASRDNLHIERSSSHDSLLRSSRRSRSLSRENLGRSASRDSLPRLPVLGRRSTSSSRENLNMRRTVSRDSLPRMPVLGRRSRSASRESLKSMKRASSRESLPRFPNLGHRSESRESLSKRREPIPKFPVLGRKSSKDHNLRSRDNLVSSSRSDLVRTSKSDISRRSRGDMTRASRSDLGRSREQLPEKTSNAKRHSSGRKSTLDGEGNVRHSREDVHRSSTKSSRSWAPVPSHSLSEYERRISNQSRSQKSNPIISMRMSSSSTSTTSPRSTISSGPRQVGTMPFRIMSDHLEDSEEDDDKVLRTDHVYEEPKLYKVSAPYQPKQAESILQFPGVQGERNPRGARSNLVRNDLSRSSGSTSFSETPV